LDEADSEENALASNISSRRKSLKTRREDKNSQTALSSTLDRVSSDKKSRPKLITSSQMQTSPVESPKSSRYNQLPSCQFRRFDKKFSIIFSDVATSITIIIITITTDNTAVNNLFKASKLVKKTVKM